MPETPPAISSSSEVPATSPAPEANLLALLERMAGRLADLETRSRQLAENYDHLDEQIRLASQVQQDLLPSPDLRVHGARIHTLYRPLDRISGDIYDVARLDETHVGISLADAAGHGMPSALLTVFIKRSFKGKEIFNGSYRIVPPAEILARLNGDIQEANLSQCRFVTALHAVYDEPRRRLTFARGGLPYPVHIPQGQPPRQIRSRGGLVGAFKAGRFETAELDLHPGDKMLFYTDGLDALVLGRARPDRPNDIQQTSWFRQLADRSAAEILREVDRRRSDIARDDWHPDDLTAVILDIEN